MQFNMTTDYAIRSILYITESQKIVSVEEVGIVVGIPHPYMKKLLYRLNKAGLIEAVRGRNGGYFIAKPPEKISVWDIAKATEQTMQIDLYLEDKKEGNDVLQQFYSELQELMEDKMKKTTIQSLIDEERNR